ncbi:hypothetical protein [Azomonas macrocytogenes]|uniref:Lipoprotein n=1 Tax=Azomonas macrocytogenes TaxID=69962 RepID=A0A839T4E4_AZOMA|nr:hypothetical protein [Azomonas macrocytogenes]MBB3103204.1 hypothetical protein [Azomonas macrocytogenes]
MKHFYIGMATLALLGCAATTANFYPHEIKEAESVKAYPASVTPPRHTVIRDIESNSCDSKAAIRYPHTKGESLWLLKLRAVRLGGDAVVEYSCHRENYDLISRCMESMRCEGKAAKLD